MTGHMKDFLKHIFPLWYAGSGQYVQLVARRLGKYKDVAYCSDPNDVRKYVKAWTQQGYDVYYCIDCLSDINKKVKDWKWKRLVHPTGERRRHVILDFDFKDQQQKFKAVRPVVEAVGKSLGKPNFVVSSGGGVHLYYEVPAKQQGNLIDLQGRAMAKFAVADDMQPIVDRRACRAEKDLIRLPGGVNQKHHKKVQWMHYKGTQLLQHKRLPKHGIGANRLNLKGFHYLGTNPYADNFDTFDAGPYCHLPNLVKVCAASRQFIEDSHNGFKRDGKLVGSHEDVLQWCSIAKYSTPSDGNTTIEDHQQKVLSVMLSHPNASKEWLHYQFESVRFPRSCERWSDDYTGSCAKCKYKMSYDGAAQPSPIGAAKKYYTEESVQEELQLLKKQQESKQTEDLFCSTGAFFVNEYGLFRARGEGKTPWLVSTKGFRLYRSSYQDENGFFVIAHNTTTKQNHVLKSRNQEVALLDELLKMGVTITNPTSKNHNPKRLMMEYWTLQVEQTFQAPNTLGWFNGSREFYLPEASYNNYNAKAITVGYPPVMRGSVRGYAYKLVTDPLKGLKLWWAAANNLYFSKPLMVFHSRMILASFASILYAVIPVERTVAGHTLVLVGQGNVGKTQTLMAAASVWGNDGYSSSRSDTFTYTLNTLGMLKNLPITFDDILRSADLKDQDIAALVHNITEGQSRGRANISGANQKVVNFSGMLLCTSNESFSRVVIKQNSSDQTAQAAMDRYTQHILKDLRQDFVDAYDIDLVELSNQSLQTMTEYGGLAGREFCKYVLHNIEPLIKKAGDIADEIRESFLIVNRHNLKFETLLRLSEYILIQIGRIPAVNSYTRLKETEVIDAQIVEQSVSYSSIIPSAKDFYHSIRAMRWPSMHRKDTKVLDARPPKDDSYNKTSLRVWDMKLIDLHPRLKQRCRKEFKEVPSIAQDRAMLIPWSDFIMNSTLKHLGVTREATDILNHWKKQGEVLEFTARSNYWHFDNEIYNGKIVLVKI